MKNLSIILMCLLFSPCGCSSDGKVNSQGYNFFYTASTNTSPVFEPASTTPKLNALFATWETNNIQYELFNLLRQYLDESDDTKVTIDNIYRYLYKAGASYSSEIPKCVSINETTLPSPYDFGNETTYSCAANEGAARMAYAIKDATDTKYALFSWQKILASNGDEKGVIQSTYNDVTGSVALDMVVLVQYPAANNHSLRLELSGNEKSNSFTIRLIKHTEDGYYISITGSGISQGAGNSFLMKMKDSAALISPKYYCYGTTADETVLKAADDTGKDSVDPDCSIYESAVEALAFFAPADVPQKDEDFNTGNREQGSIYLDGIAYIASRSE